RVRGRRRVVVHHCRRTPGDDRGRRAAVVDRRDRELPFRGARRVALEPIVDLRRVRANIVLRVFLRRLQVRETGRSGNGGHARSGGLVPQPLRQLVVGQPDVLVDAVSTVQFLLGGQVDGVLVGDLALSGPLPAVFLLEVVEGARAVGSRAGRLRAERRHAEDRLVQGRLELLQFRRRGTEGLVVGLDRLVGGSLVHVGAERHDDLAERQGGREPGQIEEVEVQGEVPNRRLGGLRAEPGRRLPRRLAHVRQVVQGLLHRRRGLVEDVDDGPPLGGLHVALGLPDPAYGGPVPLGIVGPAPFGGSPDRLAERLHGALPFIIALVVGDEFDGAVEVGRRGFGGLLGRPPGRGHGPEVVVLDSGGDLVHFAGPQPVLDGGPDDVGEEVGYFAENARNGPGIRVLTGAGPLDVVDGAVPGDVLDDGGRLLLHRWRPVHPAGLPVGLDVLVGGVRQA